MPIIAGLTFGCSRGERPPEVLALPTVEQIAEMGAGVPPIAGFGIDPISEFIVPHQHVPDILFWLWPGERDRYSVSEGVEKGVYCRVADILIRTKDGNELRLRCHDWGCNPVAFTAHGKDYYLGRRSDQTGEPEPAKIDGGVELCFAIKRAHEAQAK
ncbi:hypothetical protein [Frigoriglobus tundricola]|uniref:hypothetical protein n=1 Tax=Frigoriglobus tundricola TaxID=2774151 RepID=UPI001D08A9D3|nr:hypothetical protein [Frigoriglobus tundricola]